MNTIFVDSEPSAWAAAIDQVYRALGGAENPQLFPYHFLQTTLPRIGGGAVLFQADGALLGVGFLFPRFEPSQTCYTLRLHRLANAVAADFTPAMEQLSANLTTPEVSFYEPGAVHGFAPTHTLHNTVDIGRPADHEAVAIRTLQQQVWGSEPGYLYPADMHSVEFGLGTSLVARMDDQPVGFLFGFDKLGADPLPADWQTRFRGERRIESQTLGVLPAYRGARLGFLLKRMQAELALQRNIQVINWTVDPLQWPNALLNFGQLRAMAFDFMPDYYAFRNDLNRLPASRFGITWLVNSARVQEALRVTTQASVTKPQVLDLQTEHAILRVNEGCQQIAEPSGEARIAIEIPANWTKLQSENLAEAIQWRTTTDQLFQHVIGDQPDQYVVTGVAVAGERHYLVAERVNEGLWLRLSGP